MRDNQKARRQYQLPHNKLQTPPGDGAATVQHRRVNAAKFRLSRAEIELVRVEVLRYMSTRELSAEQVAHWIPTLRPDSLRKFLQGRRPSQRVAVELAIRLPLGLRYCPPELVATEILQRQTPPATGAIS